MLGKACDTGLDLIHLSFTPGNFHSLSDRVSLENELLDHEKASSTLELSFPLVVSLRLFFMSPFKIPFAKTIRMIMVLQHSDTVAFTKYIVHFII
jgi:hypothetical protein